MGAGGREGEVRAEVGGRGTERIQMQPALSGSEYYERIRVFNSVDEQQQCVRARDNNPQ